jgi:hypothetical protein
MWSILKSIVFVASVLATPMHSRLQTALNQEAYEAGYRFMEDLEASYENDLTFEESFAMGYQLAIATDEEFDEEDEEFYNQDFLGYYTENDQDVNYNDAEDGRLPQVEYSKIGKAFKSLGSKLKSSFKKVGSSLKKVGNQIQTGVVKAYKSKVGQMIKGVVSSAILDPMKNVAAQGKNFYNAAKKGDLKGMGKSALSLGMSAAEFVPVGKFAKIGVNMAMAG